MANSYPVMAEAEEFYYTGNEIGVLICHGFTGTTQSLRYLGSQIAKQGFTVYGPRLTGHGTHPEDMENASYKDWIEDVEQALQKLKETCTTIFVAGLSMGGTLALYLAENHPELAGIIPINAAIDIQNLKDKYDKLNGKERFLKGLGSNIKRDGVEVLGYLQTPVKSIGDFLTIMELVREDLKRINMPTLLVSSTVDHVVPPENTREVYHCISSTDKTIVFLKNSYHVATLDNDKELVAKECIRFIKNRLPR